MKPSGWQKSSWLPIQKMPHKWQKMAIAEGVPAVHSVLLTRIAELNNLFDPNLRNKSTGFFNNHSIYASKNLKLPAPNSSNTNFQ